MSQIKLIKIGPCRNCNAKSAAVIKTFPDGKVVIYCDKCEAATQGENSLEEAAKTWNWRPGMEE